MLPKNYELYHVVAALANEKHSWTMEKIRIGALHPSPGGIGSVSQSPIRKPVIPVSHFASSGVVY